MDENGIRVSALQFFKRPAGVALVPVCLIHFHLRFEPRRQPVEQNHSLILGVEYRYFLHFGFSFIDLY